MLAPLMEPGVVGMEFTVIACDEEAEVPQPFVAVTLMLPLVASAVALMLVVVDVPDQPPGKVQL